MRLKSPMTFIKKSKGLTLTELLIVISILVFLLALMIFLFRLQILKGNDAKRKGDIHKIQVAVEEYEKDNNCYPLPHLVVCSPGTSLKPYINKIPCDPSTDGSYFYDHDDSLCPAWYRIFASLENESDEDYIAGGVGPGYAFDYYASSPNAPNPDVGEENGNGGNGNGGNGNGGSPSPPPITFYGCRSGICVQILWNSDRPGPECDPNFQNSTCYGQCGPPEVECQQWMP